MKGMRMQNKLSDKTQYITRGEIASKLGVNPSTILRWELKGDFPAGYRLTKNHGTVRYLLSDVEEHLNNIPRSVGKRSSQDA